MFTIKIIGARGMGKTIFFIAFLHSLVLKGIIKYEDILVFCRAFNQREQWIQSGFEQKNFNNLREDLAYGKLLVF